MKSAVRRLLGWWFEGFVLGLLVGPVTAFGQIVGEYSRGEEINLYRALDTNIPRGFIFYFFFPFVCILLNYFLREDEKKQGTKGTDTIKT